jgi:hypothetical protein
MAFDDTAKAIAMNGVSFSSVRIGVLLTGQKCFVERMFRMEDLQAYMMRLFLEYAVCPFISFFYSQLMY